MRCMPVQDEREWRSDLLDHALAEVQHRRVVGRRRQHEQRLCVMAARAELGDVLRLSAALLDDGLFRLVLPQLGSLDIRAEACFVHEDEECSVGSELIQSLGESESILAQFVDLGESSIVENFGSSISNAAAHVNLPQPASRKLDPECRFELGAALL